MLPAFALDLANYIKVQEKKKYTRGISLYFLKTSMIR